MRGKAGPNSAHNMASGITPAYAGKSPARGLVAAAVWDHPRVCGEKMAAYKQHPCIQGSPPRMRGKAPKPDRTDYCAGITPAYAGKRRKLKSHSPSTQDHPRVCGEKLLICSNFFSVVGSPPRMRGKDIRVVCGCPGIRITPAYAGKRKLSHCELLPRWDHPRVCGEKYHRGGMAAAQRGSPPRMRGKVDGSAQLWPLHGITPAYAGKSSVNGWPSFAIRDHPRVCGEKTKKIP